MFEAISTKYDIERQVKINKREVYIIFILFLFHMKTVITWVLLVGFGFVMWAGVGFKVFQWVSGDLVAEAWDNSYKQFQQTYPGSKVQKQTDAMIEQKKQALVDEVKAKLSDYIMNLIKGGSGVTVTVK